jgi:MFS family permease
VTTPPPRTAGPPGDSIFDAEHRTLTLGVVAVITVAAFEAMGVITAMPVTVRDLDGLSLYAWTFTAFVVTSLFAMVVAGESADRRGPVSPLMVGAGLFASGTLVAGLAPTMAWFLLGRAVQGLGSGAVIVAVYVVIGRGYPEHMRPRMFTALSGAWIVPGLLGPALAGTVTDTVGWRWVYIGVLVLMVPIVVTLVPRLVALHLPGDPGSRPQPGRKRRALMAAVGTGLLQYAGQRLDRWSLLVVAAGLLLLALSVPRLLPAGALRLRRGLPTVVMERGFVAGAFFAAEAFIPLMLVNERGLSSAHAGLTISGTAVGWFLGSWYQGRPATKRSRPSLVRLGNLVVTIGIALTALVLIPAVPTAVSVVTWGTGAFGMGVAMASLGVLLLDLSPVPEQGANSAAFQVADSLGVVVATGAAGAVFAAGHVAPGRDAGVYLVIFAAATALAAFATALAGRVRPRQRVPA